jgi:hypothetical protein
MGKLNAKKWLIIIVAILLVCFIGQYVIVTDSGKVRVEDTQWVTDDGTSLHGKMYIPDSADAQNPAPAVVTCHGFNNTVGDMENNNIELSRRGYVVISVDMAGHGSSSTANGLMTNDDAVDGALDNNVGLDYEGDALVIDGGVYSALQYLGSLPYVDVESIGLIGHSGGAMAISAGAWRALANHETDSNVIIPNSIIVSCDGASRDYNEFSVNIGTITPEFDEFGPGHWNVEKPTQATTTAKMKQFFGMNEDAQDLEFNSYYIKGQDTPITKEEAIEAAANRELRVPYLIDGANHPDVNYSEQAISDVITFFDITLRNGESTIAADNQVWQAKNVFGMICLIGFFIIMLPIADMLLKTKAFGSLVRTSEVQISSAAAVSAGSRAKYWIFFIIGIIPTMILFYPIMGSPIVDKFQGWISDTLWPVSSAFPMPIVNALALFMLVCAGIAIVLCAVYSKLSTKSGNTSIKFSAFKIGLKDFGKAIILAVILLFFAYLALSCAQYFFNIDFRCLILNIMPVEAVRWKYFLVYIIFFVVYYVINSFVLNITIARPYKKEWVNYLTCVIFNAGGLLILRLADQIGFAATGIRPLFNYSNLGNNSSMAYVLTISTIFVLAMNAILSRFLYKKTNNIWVSGFACAFTAAFIVICNTVLSSAGAFY